MMKNIKYRTIVLIVFTVICNTVVADNIINNNDSMKEDKLIEREILFGNPEKAGVKISHDGKYISYLAPHEGVLNVWIAPVDDKSNAKLITSDKKRGIRSYFWSKDSQYIIYAQDKKRR